ncbi:MAG: FAD-binding protein [Verrucomicrobia bacterium]|nr:FAD-binding protein [Verrucomicrobiota bacterium]
MSLFSRHQQALVAAGCEVRFDNLTRQLYATDASIYQIEPMGVAFPRSSQEASAVIRAAADAGVSVVPRGAGSGLVGGAIGEGLVVDFARHNRRIFDLDLEARSVWVGAGVVLDQLNDFLKPHGFCFGPDVATSSRATLGGMIANNSSGARAPLYGTTADHVAAITAVLADGRIGMVGAGNDFRDIFRTVEHLTRQNAAEIKARTEVPANCDAPPPAKRAPGYGLNRFLWKHGSLVPILAGSEGTLAGVLTALLKIVPLPREKGLGLIFFASVADAMQATVELLDLKPAAIEHVDRVLFDQTRGQLQFQAARDLLELDARPCEAFLIIEFYDDVAERLAALAKKRLGLRTQLVTGAAEMNLVWALRKAGLSLLTGCAGPAKPVTCIEDTAVRPERLPEYVAGLQSILKPLGVIACFYGHAAAGLLHVRPVLDLHTADGVKKLRQITSEVSALVRQFKGSFAAEHGVGVARTEFLREQLGDELLGVMREIKRLFDPQNVFNPGKILDDGRYKIDTHLRLGTDHEIKLPFEPVLAFARKDGSFIRNLEQCNGCGGCVKQTPTMCPTFLATGEEIMSTRGRANTIRAVLEGRGAEGHDPLHSAELDMALSNCLSCKACTTECPSNVNLTLLKAELTHARHRQEGIPLLARVVSHVDLLGKLGTLAPNLANAALEWPWLRRLMAKTLGLEARRPLPRFAAERFDAWFAGRGRRSLQPRGPVILWDDCFVRYYEPRIGQAAVAVLEAAGFEVRLLPGRQCCGRPAFSQGRLDQAAALGRHNLELMRNAECGMRNGTDSRDVPILFLEASCWSMFAEDYRELKLEGAECVARRCFLFEQFIEDLLSREPDALRFSPQPARVAIHAHCHAKSLLNPAFMPRLLARLPGREAVLLETACCGMAGAFGAMTSKYDLSLKLGAMLAEKISAQPAGTVLVASGTSCRQQIEHLTPARPKHLAEVLAEALAAR